MYKITVSPAKFSFSFFSLATLLLTVVSMSFGTISSSANSNNNENRRETIIDLQSKHTINRSLEVDRFDLLTNGNTNFLDGNLIGQTSGLSNIAFDSNVENSVQNLSLVVTRSDDRNETCNSGVDCSLREAVNTANVGAGDDTINFSAELTTITLTDQIVINNNGMLVINGRGANVLKIDGGTGYNRIFYTNSASVNITGVTLSGGFPINGNAETFGGAIYANAGSLTLDRVHVTGNSGDFGGGIYFGGGVNHQILNSTLSANSSSSGGGFNNSGANLSVFNSTISGNTASVTGGGFYNNYGNTILLNVTITDNTVTTGTSTGGGISHFYGTLNIGNTIIAGNRTALVNGHEIDFRNGTIISLGNNLVGDSPGNSANTGLPITYQASDIRDTPPMLSALGMYGGTTPTHALLTGSPAINAGNNANVPATTDQRGFARIVDGTVDIGAFESELGCLSSINPISQQISAAGGTTSVSVTTPSGCQWTAVSNANWIIVTGGNNGSGNGTVSITVQANNGVARTGTVTIAGKTFTINQASGCAYTLSPASTTIPATGGNGSFGVTSAAGCSWTAQSNSSWITITSGNNGTGNGTVSFSVQANTGSARSGTITVNGQIFTVNQATGCVFSLPLSGLFYPATGGSDTVGVFLISGNPTSCTWTAVSNVPWVTITSGSSGTGSGSFSFTVAPNTDSARTGTITVAGMTFTVTQGSDCVFSLSSTDQSFPGTGGTGSFNVNVRAGCSWTAASNVPWITVTLGNNGTGSGTVSYSVAANNGPARTGTIIAGGQAFTVFQASGCVYTLSPTSATIPATGGTGSFNISSAAGCPWTAVSNADWITITSGSSGTGSGTISFSIASFTGDPRTGTISVGGQTFTVVQALVACKCGIDPKFDFDGDGKADISVFRPETGTWFLNQSADGFSAVKFGIPTDKIVPADYDGDGKTDIAVFRPSDGTWYILASKDGFTAMAFGVAEDIPVPADYDGDGRADIAVFRPSDSTWYIQSSKEGFFAVQFGQTGDKPTIGDFDGDGKFDIAVFRPSTGFWHRINSSTNERISILFGEANDLPVAADYDGDKKTDIAFYRPSNGTWYMQQSNVGFTTTQFGIETDKPVPADYDGDGKADLAVYRDGIWYLQRSLLGFTALAFGNPTDKPVPNAFIR